MSKKFLLLAPALLILAGCTEGYRYPCQDPENWEEKFCKKPYCSANGTCPEDLTHYEKTPGQNSNIPSQGFSINKGECK
jgi:hypothetical protein